MPGIKGMGAPSGIAAPVPGDDLAGQVMSDLANSARPTPLPPVSVAAEPIAVPSAPQSGGLNDGFDEFFGDAAQSAPQTTAAAPAGLGDGFDDFFDAPAADNRSFIDKAVDNVKEFGSDIALQAKASLVPDERKQLLLEESFGKENVRKDGDTFYVTKNGKEEKFTRSMWDMFKNMMAVAAPATQPILGGSPIEAAKDIAANAATIPQEAVALPLELGGAAIGSLGGPVGSAVGLATGRMAAGIAGEYTSKYIADKIGIPEDPNEKPGDTLARGIFVGTMRSVLGAAGDKISSSVQARLGKKGAEFARREAEQAAVPEQYVQNIVRDLEATDEAITKLQKAGILDDKFMMRPDQAVDDPALKAAANQASKSSLFRDIAERQGQMMTDAWDKLATSAAKLKGGIAGTAERTIKSLNSADDAFGGLIGKARQELIEKAPNSLLETGETSGVVSTMRQELGFSTKLTQAGMVTEHIPPEKAAERIANQLSISSPDRLSLADNLVKWTTEIGDLMANNSGKVPVKDANRLYNELIGHINARIGNSQDRAYVARMIKLKDALRDDMAEGVTKHLGQMNGISYEANMARYRVFRETEKQLGNLLEREGMGSDQLLNYLFTKGSKGNERIGAIKRIMDTTDPEMFESLKGAWMRKLMDDNSFAALDKGKSRRLGYDWVKINKGIESLGDDTLNQIFKPDELSAMRDFMKIAESMQKADFQYVANEAIDKTFRGKLARAITLATKFIGYGRSGPGKVNADAADLVLHIAPDDMARKYLTNEGREEILNLIPASRKPEVRSMLEKIEQRTLNLGDSATRVPAPMKTAPLVGEAARGIGEGYSEQKPR